MSKNVTTFRSLEIIPNMNLKCPPPYHRTPTTDGHYMFSSMLLLKLVLRLLMTQVEQNGFTNLKSWRAHWDRQLYKGYHNYKFLSYSEFRESGVEPHFLSIRLFEFTSSIYNIKFVYILFYNTMPKKYCYI